MSFLKIKDPLKREQTVKDFLALKKRIHDNQLTEKEGKLKYQQQLSRFFRPVTETLGPIKKGVKNVESIIKLKGFPSVLAFDIEKFDSDEIISIKLESEEKGTKMPYFLGKIAEKQLKRYDKEDEVDTTFGFYEKNGRLYIGDKEVDINGNYLMIVGEQDYDTDSSGLWELIISINPDNKKYDKTDFNFYEEIMIITNALYYNNNPLEGRHKYVERNLKPKWRNILNNIWKRINKIGRGITIIPSNPNALLERLDLLMASKRAGHTGVRNELVSICDELKRQRILDAKAYKKLMSLL